MGNILKAIHDDMEDYEDLCKHFNETPQKKPDAYGNMLLDCYGPHAKELQKRFDAEQEAKRKK